MRKLFFLILLIGTFSFYAQETSSSFYFQQAQPANLQSSLKIEEDHIGAYYKSNDSLVRIIVEKDSIYTEFSIVFIYSKEELKANLLYSLPSEQSHYIKNVMRLKPGDTFSLFNSMNGEWRVKIVNHNKENIEFKVEKLVKERKLENDLWLAFSPIKKNSLDMMIQKTTELGIQKFIPILSERTIVKDINTQRLKKIIIEASEQSNRISVPEIKKLESLKIFLNNFPNDGFLIFCDINCEKSNLKDILSKKKQKPICILIGPEGDFSEKERQLIIGKKEIFSLSLASNILRAETAAIAAVTIVNYHLNF